MNKGKKKNTFWKVVLFVIFVLVLGGGFLIAYQFTQYKYLAVVELKNGKKGYINEKGKEVIGCRFDYVEDFDENGLAIVGTEKGMDEEGNAAYMYGCINKEGEEIIPCRYRKIDILDDIGKLIAVERDNYEWGIFNEKGEKEVGWKDGIIGRLNYGWVTVDVSFDDKTLKTGVINRNGDEVTPCKYEDVWQFCRCDPIYRYLYSVVSVGNIPDLKYGIINMNGDEVVPPEYDSISIQPKINSPDGLIRAGKKDKFGYINLDGEEVISFRYDVAGEFGNNGLAIVGEAGNSFIIDEKGEKLIECEHFYDSACAFGNNGLACVSYNGRYGWINERGDEVIECEYDNVTDNICFEREFDDNGLVGVMKNGKWGVINERGKEIIPCSYNELYFLDNGLVMVKKDGKAGCFNKTGQIVLPLQYTDIAGYDLRHGGNCMVRYLEVMTEGLGSNLIAYKDGKIGLFNEMGEEIIPCIYEKFDMINQNGFFVAYKGKNAQGQLEKPVLLNTSGEIVISEKYEKIGNERVSGRYISTFSDLIPVYDGKQWRYVDYSGNTIKELPEKYMEVGEFIKVQ